METDEDWHRLFAVALSHGKQLEQRQLCRARFDTFLVACGIDHRISRTGVSKLYVDVLWTAACELRPTDHRQLRPSGVARALLSSFDDAQLGPRHDGSCESGAWAPLGLSQFRQVLSSIVERIALHRSEGPNSTGQASEVLSVADAFAAHFEKHVETSVVQVDTKMTLDPHENEWSTVTRRVIGTVMDASFEPLVRPIFDRCCRESPGFMSFANFRFFVKGFELSDVIDDDLVFNIFNEANSQDTKGLLSGTLGVELEIDEFADALLMLAVAYFSDEEVRYPMHVTLQSKVVAFWQLLLAKWQAITNGEGARSGVDGVAAMQEAFECEGNSPHEAVVHAGIVWPPSIVVDRTMSFIAAGVHFFNADRPEPRARGPHGALDAGDALDAVHALQEAEEAEERRLRMAEARALEEQEALRRRQQYEREKGGEELSAAALLRQQRLVARTATAAARSSATALVAKDAAELVPPLHAGLGAAPALAALPSAQLLADPAAKTLIINAALQQLPRSPRSHQAANASHARRRAEQLHRPTALELAEGLFDGAVAFVSNPVERAAAELLPPTSHGAPSRSVLVRINGLPCEVSGVRRNRVKVTLPAAAIDKRKFVSCCSVAATPLPPHEDVWTAAQPIASSKYHFSWGYKFSVRRAQLAQVAVGWESGGGRGRFASRPMPLLLELCAQSQVFGADPKRIKTLTRVIDLFQSYAMRRSRPAEGSLPLPLRSESSAEVAACSCEQPAAAGALFMARDGFARLIADNPQLLPQSVHPPPVCPSATHDAVPVSSLFDLFALSRPSPASGTASSDTAVHPWHHVVVNGWDFQTSIDIDSRSGAQIVVHQPVAISSGSPTATPQGQPLPQPPQCAAEVQTLLSNESAVLSFTGFMLVLLHAALGRFDRTAAVDFKTANCPELLQQLMSASSLCAKLRAKVDSSLPDAVDIVYSARVAVPFKAAMQLRAFEKSQSPCREQRWSSQPLLPPSRPAQPSSSRSRRAPGSAAGPRSPLSLRAVPSISISLERRSQFLASVSATLATTHSPLAAGPPSSRETSTTERQRSSASNTRRRPSFTELILSPSDAAEIETRGSEEGRERGRRSSEANGTAETARSAMPRHAPLLSGVKAVPCHVALVSSEARTEYLHQAMHRTAAS